MSKKVAILGGGVAGMSAAQELIERGFQVEVFEFRGIPGGKARSIPVPNSGKGGRKDLPGEHGFRFFPRFYRHVIDTMARIPYGIGGKATVADNLVDTTRVGLQRYDKPPLVAPSRFPRNLADVRLILRDFQELLDPSLGISHEEMAYFAARTWQIITSCSERRNNEYEKIGWWDYIGAAERSEGYQKLLGTGFTRSLVAAKADVASTKTVGDMFIQMLFDVTTPGPSSDRLLNGPTNEVWIQPWLDYLRSRGVIYHLDARVWSINVRNGVVESATVELERRRRTEVRADYFLSALPVEHMAKMLTPEMTRTDPNLVGISHLAGSGVDWMNGIQLYLTSEVELEHGHSIYLDSPWALTSVAQDQFWPDFDLKDYGDGQIRSIISIDISDWDKPGICGKSARECTREEIRTEVWEQVKRSVNHGGLQILRDEDLHHWFLDPDIIIHATDQGAVRTESTEPLLVNLIDTWKYRPDAVTAVPNLFLASDYVRTYTDLATMEGANEAARRAVNGILHSCGADADPCGIWQLHEPEIFRPWRAMDHVRYSQGLPWDDKLTVFALSGVSIVQRTADFLETALGGAVMNVGGAVMGGGAERATLPGGLDVPAEDAQALGMQLAGTVQKAIADLSASLFRSVGAGRGAGPAEMAESAVESVQDLLGAAVPADQRVPPFVPGSPSG